MVLGLTSRVSACHCKTANAGNEDTVSYSLDEGADINEAGIEDDTDERETRYTGKRLCTGSSEGKYRCCRAFAESKC